MNRACAKTEKCVFRRTVTLAIPLTILSVMLSGFTIQKAQAAPPVANNDNYATDENTILAIPPMGVLDNDIDIMLLVAVKVTNPAHGMITLNLDGSFIYTPTTDYHGVDSFTYKAFNSIDYSNTATVTITVYPMSHVAGPHILLETNSLASGSHTIELFDMKGRMIVRKTFFLAPENRGSAVVDLFSGSFNRKTAGLNVLVARVTTVRGTFAGKVITP